MRLDHLSKQFDQFKATTTFNSPDDREVLATTCMGASEEDARPGKCCSMQSANALQGILSDAEDLEDEVDVDMAEGAKAGPGECSSGSEVYSSPSAFQGLSDDEVAEELAQSLGEIETNVIHMFKVSILNMCIASIIMPNNIKQIETFTG